MGKGDKKSRRGKITIGSFGVRRPSKPKKVDPSTLPVKEKVVKEKLVEKSEEATEKKTTKRKKKEE